MSTNRNESPKCADCGGIAANNCGGCGPVCSVCFPGHDCETTALRARVAELEKARDEANAIAASNFDAHRITRERAERAEAREEELRARVAKLETELIDARADVETLESEVGRLESLRTDAPQHVSNLYLATTAPGGWPEAVDAARKWLEGEGRGTAGEVAVAEIRRLREAAEDIAALHAHHLEDCTITDEEANALDLDDHIVEHRHHARTCGLAHALYILNNSREERERIRREACDEAPF